MKKGYTLIELLIVITTASMLVGGLGVFILKGMDIWAFFKNQNAAQIRARLAMDRMTKDIRKMKSPADIILMYDHQIRFNILEPDLTPNRIGFALYEGNSFIYYDRNAAAVGSPYSPGYIAANSFTEEDTYLKFELVPNVSELAITYWGVSAVDGTLSSTIDYNEFQHPDWPAPGSKGRLIKIILTVQEGNKTFMLVSVVGLRNNVP